MSRLDEGEYLKFRNPTHTYWKKLAEQGYPFIKVELLRDNPVAIDIRGWESVAEKAGVFRAEAVIEHLATLGCVPAHHRLGVREMAKDYLRRLVRGSFRLNPVHRALVRKWRLMMQRQQKSGDHKRKF